MNITSERAEIAGLLAADGNIQEEHISFWGNPVEDKEYYDKHLIKLFEKAFSFTPRPHHKQSNQVYGFYVCRPDIIKWFVDVGFTIGNKTYTVRVPKPIINHSNPQVWAAFIRGYFDGDGCFTCFQRGKDAHIHEQFFHVAPRISATSASKKLIEDVCELFTKLKIKYAVSYHRITGNKQKAPYWRITLNGVRRVKKYQKIIGFGNRSKRDKFSVFERYAYVPPGLNHPEMRAILKGEVSPFRYYMDP